MIDWGDDLSANASINFHGGQALDGKSWLNQVQTLTGGQVRWSDKDIFDGKQATSSTTGSQDSKTTTDADKEKTALAVSTTEIKAVKSLVFIDTKVENYQALLKGIDPNSTVILLDSTKNGVEQIAQEVAHYNNIDAIHIISHGNTGDLYLGSATLNLASMRGQYSDELALIGRHLSTNADILIYGCNFGQGDVGLQATNQLAALTGADIADSTNNTGAAALGGDWVLENQVGIIESPELNLPEWNGLLVTVDVAGGLLKFTTPALQTGTNKSVGAVYKYTNVLTVGGVQVDAFVTITGITSASIVTIDDPNPNGNANYTLTSASGATFTVADDDLFAPQITTTAANGKVDFAINFKDSSGNPVTLLNFYNNSIDIDSPEFVEYGGFQTYSLGSPTDLSVTPVAGTDKLRFTGSGGYAGLTLNDVGRIEAKFNSIDTLQISMGSTANASTRQFGSIFTSSKFASSVTVTAPTVNALTTDDTTPIITGTVGATNLGVGEAFTVTVKGVTYTRASPELQIIGTNWTLSIPAGDTQYPKVLTRSGLYVTVH